ncbi:hypothetical protein LCGC14_0205200 [marine sediment metagenome]|uniref:Uncharacterized protein n=1 Tax=marine sediment metagenome TaxID=412755 RepID=A0A0F9UZ45_9ZZZZ
MIRLLKQFFIICGRIEKRRAAYCSDHQAMICLATVFNNPIRQYVLDTHASTAKGAGHKDNTMTIDGLFLCAQESDSVFRHSMPEPFNSSRERWKANHLLEVYLSVFIAFCFHSPGA